MSNQKIRLRKLRVAILMACFAYNLSAGNSLQVTDLKCEYATDPIGLDVESPQLSWRIESGSRGTLQSSYRITVGDSPVDSGTGSVIWDQDNQSAVSDGSDFFEMGLIRQEDWEVRWYGRLSSWTGRPLYYRCKFSLEKPVWKARVYVSGLVRNAKIPDIMFYGTGIDYLANCLKIKE